MLVKSQSPCRFDKTVESKDVTDKTTSFQQPPSIWQLPALTIIDQICDKQAGRSSTCDMIHYYQARQIDR